MRILNCLNKQPVKGERRFTDYCPKTILFSFIWYATSIFQPFPQGVFLYTTVSIKRTNMATNICASRVCMMVGDTSSMPQNYINCRKLRRCSCALTAFSIPSSRGNKISQTAQTLGSHIYSTNVDIHIIALHSPIFYAFLREIYVLLTTHRKCKVCLYFELL